MGTLCCCRVDEEVVYPADQHINDGTWIDVTRGPTKEGKIK